MKLTAAILLPFTVQASVRTDFDKLDDNGDGSISRREFDAHMRNMKKALPRKLAGHEMTCGAVKSMYKEAGCCKSPDKLFMDPEDSDYVKEWFTVIMTGTISDPAGFKDHVTGWSTAEIMNCEDTLAQEWYVNDDMTEFTLIESFTDSAAQLCHFDLAWMSPTPETAWGNAMAPYAAFGPGGYLLGTVPEDAAERMAPFGFETMSLAAGFRRNMVSPMNTKFTVFMTGDILDADKFMPLVAAWNKDEAENCPGMVEQAYYANEDMTKLAFTHSFVDAPAQMCHSVNSYQTPIEYNGVETTWGEQMAGVFGWHLQGDSKMYGAVPEPIKNATAYYFSEYPTMAYGFRRG